MIHTNDQAIINAISQLNETLATTATQGPPGVGAVSSVLTADFSTSTTPQTVINDLSVTLEANATYLVRARLLLQGPSASSHCPRPGFDWPVSGVVAGGAKLTVPNYAASTAVQHTQMGSVNYISGSLSARRSLR